MCSGIDFIEHLVRVNLDMIIWREWRAGQIRCRVMLDNQLSRDTSTVIPPPSVVGVKTSRSWVGGPELCV